MTGDWAGDGSPFHRGEQDVQARLGVRDRVETFARRAVRDFMPDQHRTFYGQLPFLVLGTVDDEGRPWASLVVGRPGFAGSPDDRTLTVAARPMYGDPLNGTLHPGADVGILGIELETRRRNRISGRIAAAGPEGFTVAVKQTFGNCPQYIQTRSVAILPEVDEVGRRRPVIAGDRLDSRAQALVERSDTLFIATAYVEDEDAAPRGADVSHRGGKPGFILVEDDRTLMFPEFPGNNHFNTIGNIVLNPRAGILIPDFESGDLLYLTGHAEVVWSGERVDAFAGAERFVRFTVAAATRVEESLPLRFVFGEYSPMLDHTGSWAEAGEIVAAERERDVYVPYEVVDVKPESETITSFYLKRTDGKAVASHEPGQYLPIRLSIPGHDQPLLRTYTVSDASQARHYRLSVRREGGSAVVSNFLHDAVRPGFRLEAMAPRGRFVLDRTSSRPVVLVSAGVGITPMIAMLKHIIGEGLRTRRFRRTYFVHGARDGRSLAFGDHLRALAAAHDRLTAHIRFSRPGPDDRLGVTHDSEGHVNVDLLRHVLPFDDHDFYLCGPHGFMQSMYDGLTGLGVREERIHYESFGPATVLRRAAATTGTGPRRGTTDGPVAVTFARSGIETTWTTDRGTLLELAEAAGLNPAHSCRSGICGSCATRLRCGAVDYIEEPSAPRAEDEVLICCATPRTAAGDAGCGDAGTVVLDL